ncbi:uncharacterized protein LOC111633305 [Centruroides sculpturatus]|uniref:uncharacterized protein LOC111633305 n=1 Tax=Centruroides sculpturatus TaxID=218467 RepID=UPI000C6CB252|nr:uncharacterized protein LOC111633305 [Centruroides sculpturatus]
MYKFLFTFVIIGIILLESSEGRYMKVVGRDRSDLKGRNALGISVKDEQDLKGRNALGISTKDEQDLKGRNALGISMEDEQSITNSRIVANSQDDDERKKIEENSMTGIKGV